MRLYFISNVLTAINAAVNLSLAIGEFSFREHFPRFSLIILASISKCISLYSNYVFHDM